MPPTSTCTPMVSRGAGGTGGVSETRCAARSCARVVSPAPASRDGVQSVLAAVPSVWRIVGVDAYGVGRAAAAAVVATGASYRLTIGWPNVFRSLPALP